MLESCTRCATLEGKSVRLGWPSTGTVLGLQAWPAVGLEPNAFPELPEPTVPLPTVKFSAAWPGVLETPPSGCRFPLPSVLGFGLVPKTLSSRCAPTQVNAIAAPPFLGPEGLPLELMPEIGSRRGRGEDESPSASDPEENAGWAFAFRFARYAESEGAE